MKIALIAPGHTCIPPKGWGAVEIIIWYYYKYLTELGVTVQIINQKNKNAIIRETNAFKPDFVHIMYDDHINIVDHLESQNIGYTTHWAYLTNPEKLKNSGYNKNFLQLYQNKKKVHVFALSDEIKNVYVQHGYPANLVSVIHNGAIASKFKYKSTPNHPERSIYIGKIEDRKRQYVYQNIPNLYFVGNYHNSHFNRKRANYLGEWNKHKLYNNLTNYSNLVLLSDGEADPLVVKEALIAGLGVVVSEVAKANLDIDKGFIDVIPNSKLNDLTYVADVIDKNKLYSTLHRAEIREYALAKFDWQVIINNYLTTIQNIFRISM